MKHKQRGGSTIVGVIIGVVLGLAAALAVAVYVTKVPVPFLNKGTSRTPEQDAAESKKNQNWDPNAPLYGKNPAKALPPAPAVAASAPAAAKGKEDDKKDAKEAKDDKAKPADKPQAKASEPVPPAVAGRPPSADPLGDLAAARASSSGDPFLYFVQAGAFRTSEDAEAQRAKLSLMGIEAKVTEREQAGRAVFRVRVGPFEKREEAERQKDKLEGGGFETALVRVQR